MEYKTIAGNFYTITSKSGCSVTDATGTLSMTVDAGGQLTVQAPSDKLVYDDEQAIVFKANFKSALAVAGLLGEGDKLPAGYTRVEFLESNGRAYVNTGLKVTPTMGVRYKVWQDNDAYMVLAGNMQYSTDTKIFYPLISSQGRVGVRIGEPLYLLLDGGYASSGSDAVAGNAFVVKAEELEGEVNWLNDGQLLFKTESVAEHRPLPKAIPSWYDDFLIGTQGLIKINGYKGRMYYFDISEGARVVQRLVPALDPNGIPGWFDLATKQLLANVGTGQFIVGMTLAQARKLSKLPAGTTLTVSLPVGYDSDTGVVAALAAAEANGCVLTVQTYEAAGAAAATFALRRVWVRKVQDENGSYVAADGSRWQVDWCVDVIGADPESLGYERYRSVDAAVAYWELVPYEYPEEELSTIE